MSLVCCSYVCDRVQTILHVLHNFVLVCTVVLAGAGVLLRGGNTVLGQGVVISNNSALQQAGGVGWFSGCLAQGKVPQYLQHNVAPPTNKK